MLNAVMNAIMILARIAISNANANANAPIDLIFFLDGYSFGWLYPFGYDPVSE